MFEKLLTILTSIPKDKILHAYLSIIIYIIASLLSDSKVIPIIVVLVIGSFKEIYDLLNKSKHTPDVMDLVAALVGVLPILIYDILKN